ISSGGNSGSQAATLVIRALALGEIRLGQWWRIMSREVRAGLTLGVILGAIGFCRIAIWSAFSNLYGPHWPLVALTVGAALVGVVLWGTLAGSILPFLLRRLGFDPAVSSAPFVATLVDVTGLVIYFTVAVMILRGTLLWRRAVCCRASVAAARYEPMSEPLARFRRRSAFRAPAFAAPSKPLGSDAGGTPPMKLSPGRHRLRVAGEAALLPHVLSGHRLVEVRPPPGPRGNHQFAGLDHRGMVDQLVLPRHVVDVDLHDPHVRHRGAQMRGVERRKLAVAVVGRDVELVALGGVRD